MTLITLYPTNDAPIKQGNPNTNYDTATTGKATQFDERFLLKFDLSVIPSGSTINSATLTLYNQAGFGANIYYVQRILQNVVYNQTTWNIYSTGNNWTTAGCNSSGNDYTTSGQASAYHGMGGSGYKSWSCAALIQDWIDGAANYGMVVDRANGGDATFRTVNYSGTDYDPKLVISYTEPPPPPPEPVEVLSSYYQNLLIKQYHDKTKAKGTIDALVTQAFADWVYPQVRDAFDIDTAVGVQLDTLGKYVGVDRTSLVSQTDNNMRFMIKMKIIQNVSDHSYKSLDDYYKLFFDDQVEIYDNQDMTISLYFPLTILDLMMQALNTNSLPRPLGVAIILYAIINPNGTFGFSRLGITDSIINGYGVEGVATYEGGTYIRAFWSGI